MKKTFLLFAYLLTLDAVFAQKKLNENLATTRPQYDYKKPTLKPVVVLFVEKDMAPKRHITKVLNILLDGGRGGIKIVNGYKLMLISDRDRKKIEDAKKKAVAIFKDEEVRLVYEQPFYRVKVGAYLNKQDADDAKKKARIHFEEAIVVPEKIKIFQNFEED